MVEPSSSAGTNAGNRPAPRPRSRARRVGRAALRIPLALMWTGVILTTLVVALFAFSFVDEPMRRSMEREINAALSGYTVRVPHADFKLFGLAVTLENVEVRQPRRGEHGVVAADTVADSAAISGGGGEVTAPMVAFIPKLRASLQWRELLSFRLVSDFHIDRPQLHIDLSQVRKEVKDSVDLNDRGWQAAAQAIYPFKINLFEVTDGDLVYVDSDPEDELHIAHLDFRAGNLRNIHSKENEYPSPFHGRGVVFDSGRVSVYGHADFLAEPSPTAEFAYQLSNVPMRPFEALAENKGLTLKGGKLESNGTVEFQQAMRTVDVDNVKISNFKVDYHHMLPRAVAAIHNKAADANMKPGYTIRVDTFQLENAELGMLRRRGKGSYRLFFNNANFLLTNYSSRPTPGGNQGATAVLRARFMGSGETAARLRFRPAAGGPEFDLDLAIENTRLVSLNEMLRAHGKIDVTKGSLSFYSQLGVHNNRLTGYVKPLIKDIQVYNWDQDKRNSVFTQLYELVTDGLMRLFEKDKQVATRATLSGPVGGTHASAWEMIGNAFEHAFIRAITPGFDRLTRRRDGSE